MESLYLLIPIAIVFVIIAVAVFYWAVNNGQYDDLDMEAKRILFERDHAGSSFSDSNSSNSNSIDSNPSDKKNDTSSTENTPP